MKHFDYIFAGSGLAALMVVHRMVSCGKFGDRTILLIDSNAKKTNDRTWCLWEKPNGEWENLVAKKWDSALFADQDFKRNLDLNPYQYKMIPGVDFYNSMFEKISRNPNVTFVNETVTEISETNDGVFVTTENQNFSCGKLFNSILNLSQVQNQTKYPLLQQHFIGWKIKTGQEIFDPEQATFMDFSIEQKGNTRFIYVLPTSETEALIEYTLFSKDVLPENEYETEIQNYIQNLGISNYEIIEKERGNIPMTSFAFWKKNTKSVINIGSAGGWTKASTGYTFKNSDKRSKQLVDFLQANNAFTKFHKRNKFWFYDLLLLDILSAKNETGSQIFSALFKTAKPSLIFKFLDEETSLSEDLQIILKCPKTLFIKALLKRIF